MQRKTFRPQDGKPPLSDNCSHKLYDDSMMEDKENVGPLSIATDQVKAIKMHVKNNSAGFDRHIAKGKPAFATTARVPSSSSGSRTPRLAAIQENLGRAPASHRSAAMLSLDEAMSVGSYTRKGISSGGPASGKGAETRMTDTPTESDDASDSPMEDYVFTTEDLEKRVHGEAANLPHVSIDPLSALWAPHTSKPNRLVKRHSDTEVIRGSCQGNFEGIFTNESPIDTSLGGLFSSTRIERATGEPLSTNLECTQPKRHTVHVYIPPHRNSTMSGSDVTHLLTAENAATTNAGSGSATSVTHNKTLGERNSLSTGVDEESSMRRELDSVREAGRLLALELCKDGSENEGYLMDSTGDSSQKSSFSSEAAFLLGSSKDAVVSLGRLGLPQHHGGTSHRLGETRSEEGCRSSSLHIPPHGQGDIEGSARRGERAHGGNVLETGEGRGGGASEPVVSSVGQRPWKDANRHRRKKEVRRKGDCIDDYVVSHKVGEGAYGTVYCAKHKTTGTTVAIKEVRARSEREGVCATTIREVSILRQLSHPNIIKLEKVVMTHHRVFIVFQFIPYDLRRYIESVPAVALDLIQSYMYQTLQGLAYCHSRCVFHRDLKPENLLIDKDGSIKLADFGLSRVFDIQRATYTREVVTLWYRAPEILLGERQYSVPVDMWSLGCIFAEMVTGDPLFPGDTEIGQLFSIFRVLGTPTEADWEGVSAMPAYQAKFPFWYKKNLREVIPRLSDAGVDLLAKLLHYDPRKRISAKMSLQHPYFDSIDRTLYPIKS